MKGPSFLCKGQSDEDSDNVLPALPQAALGFCPHMAPPQHKHHISLKLHLKNHISYLELLFLSLKPQIKLQSHISEDPGVYLCPSSSTVSFCFAVFGLWNAPRLICILSLFKATLAEMWHFHHTQPALSSPSAAPHTSHDGRFLLRVSAVALEQRAAVILLHARLVGAC